MVVASMKRKERKERVKGKGLDEPCLVCKERRFTERAHFPKRKRPGEEGTETIPLCPTHHKLLDYGRLSKSEYEAIWQTRYAKQFDSVEDFIEWAYENYYPYNIKDLERKFWRYELERD